jgi:hypothetical protein
MKRLPQILALVGLGTMLALMGQPYFTNASRPIYDVNDPLLAVQMVRNVNDVDAVLSDAPSPDREVLRIKVRADFALIAAYTAVFASMGLTMRRRSRLGWAVIVLGVAAAGCDVAENIATLRLIDLDLAGTTQAMIDGLRGWATYKWSLLSLAMVVLALPFFDSKRWYLRVLGGIDVAAGALVCLGLFSNGALVTASAVWGFGLLASAATLKSATHEPAS